VGNCWLDFTDPELLAGEVAQIWTGARFEGSPSSEFLKVDDQAVTWAELHLNTTGSVRAVMDVALDRLNLARRRRSPGDQAIDASICLEALLGDDNSQELTYKLRLRAALLLGKTLSEREAIRKTVGALYQLRSKVVHGRSHPQGDVASDSRDAIRGLKVCTDAVRAIARLNARPDFAKWELTGGP
jgi:hypothetical protein